MKKTSKIMILVFAVILIFAMASTAFADYYNYSGTFRYGYSTRTFTRINDDEVKCVQTSLSVVSYVQHYFKKNGSMYGSTYNLKDDGDYDHYYNLPTPAPSEKWNSRFNNTLASGTYVSNAGHWHIYGYTGYWD